MEAVGDASGQLHLRDDLQVRRPRVHHHEPVLAGGLVVDVAHQVPVILVAVALDVVGHEERFAGEAPEPEVALRHEAAGEVGEAGVGEPDALQRIHLPGQDPGRHDGAARHPGHAVEAGEDVGQDGRAGVALHEREHRTGSSPDDAGDGRRRECSMPSPSNRWCGPRGRCCGLGPLRM
uniref:Uncharacterized protein n=1 Tax=Oryza meridionalis TaxID=40149 RepID=A0A0E0CQB0_9ORYZ